MNEPTAERWKGLEHAAVFAMTTIFRWLKNSPGDENIPTLQEAHDRLATALAGADEPNAGDAPPPFLGYREGLADGIRQATTVRKN